MEERLPALLVKIEGDKKKKKKQQQKVPAVKFNANQPPAMEDSNKAVSPQPKKPKGIKTPRKKRYRVFDPEYIKKFGHQQVPEESEKKEKEKTKIIKPKGTYVDQL